MRQPMKNVRWSIALLAVLCASLLQRAVAQDQQDQQDKDDPPSRVARLGFSRRIVLRLGGDRPQQ